MTSRRPFPLLLLLVLALAVLQWPSNARAGREYVIGFPCFDTMCSFPEFEALLTEMYARAGATVRFRRLPIERDLREANQGLIDGSLARNPEAIAQYPALVPVSPAIGEYTLSLFTLDAALADKPLNQLAGKRIGHLRGDVTAARLAREAGVRACTYGTVPGMLRMLRSGRLDAAVLPTVITRMAASPMGLANLHVFGPLSKTLFYHSLNRKHAALVPRLEAALRGMYRDGTAKRLLGRYLTFTPE